MATVQDILKSAGRGTMSAVARELGLTPGAVRQWKQVPAQYVIKIERLTNIPRTKLRPDIFEEAA